MSEIIKAADNKVKIKEIWQTLFKTNDPFVYPFTDNVGEYLFFYPTEGYFLKKVQFEALIASAKEMDDTTLIISMVETDKDFFNTEEQYVCKNLEYDDYRRLPIHLENTIFSYNAMWGLLVSQEFHAIVGGSVGFVNILKKKYPGYSEDFTILKADWVEQGKADWIKKLKNQQ